MLALINIPLELEDLESRCNELGQNIRRDLNSSGEKFFPKKGEDLIGRFPDSWIYVCRGTFHFLIENKIVRFFSAGGWVATFPHQENTQFFCEFASEVDVFEREAMSHSLANQPKVLGWFLEVRAMQERVAAHLCALQAKAPVKAPVTMVPFDAGQVILREGDVAKEVFEMVQGTASVTVNGVQISTIREGQIFGELSFFTDSNRFATVTALQDCLVQVMDKDVFMSLMHSRPQMVDTLVRTLCRRLLEADELASG